ncbi:MAG: phage baseplate assembly protein V [Acidobacteriia bacterium]|nr:phage baseplate assembly protein V [Terriglobia bacterium]
MQEAMAQMAARAQEQYFGKYRGIVFDNKDPDKMGRLRITVPSVMVDDPLTTDDESITDWATPCVPCGGMSEQGFFVIPDVGANVWVEFEEGNLDQPIWVGTFWTAPGDTTQIPTEAQDMAGTEQDLEPMRRVFKTTSGHVMEFCDIDGKESITIQHKDGAMLNMDEKGSVTVVNKSGSYLYLNADAGEASLVDESGNNVSMTSGGVTVTSKDGSIVDLAKDAVQVIAKNVHIRSQTVSLGEGAMEPAILGKTFAAMFDAHMHPTTAPGAPTGPPIPVPMPLSSPMNPAISQCVKVK